LTNSRFGCIFRVDEKIILQEDRKMVAVARTHEEVKEVKVVDKDQLIKDKLEKYLELIEQIEKLKKEADEIKRQLKEEGIGIEEPEKIILPDGRIVKVALKIQHRTLIDKKLLAEKFPGVYEEVKKEQEVKAYEIRQVKR
jgi:predicted phage-related endonuclease